MRSTLAAATAALCLVLAPTASASEITSVEYTEYTEYSEDIAIDVELAGEEEDTEEAEPVFGFYSSIAQDFADNFRCSTSPQRWWCGGR
ncbi:hypothetical protein [Corynebacterium sp.]|uniref:hypothetical protein n=1 Tax=Corynebacterium sp. TaxID=1720 RepID=UPI0026DB1402|nr:hypothetical protein [Corynebacterium sp.]MDO5032155.1 hypothetical protein [Corynebacterium sp.]